VAAWGDSRLGGNEFLLDAHQVGWRLNRAAFDRMLVEAASARVVALLKSKIVSLAKEIGGWRVSLSDGAVHTAHFAVDATGRAAALARQCRLRPVNVDRLVGCCLRTRSRSDGTEGLMIESFADGWWYSAALPGGDRVLACMTDADRVRPLKLSSVRGFALRPRCSRSAAISVFAYILLTGDRGFESFSLQRGVKCEPDFRVGPQGRQVGRSSCPTADHIRAGHQPQDR
jgi:hypothetical protein